VDIDLAALTLLARAAEGSVRDALSLLDQAIAHSGGRIEAGALRDMLGLADRGRVLDLFEKIISGKIAEGLSDLRELYDRGADPLVVMQDLLETTHFLTRVKVAPGAEGFFDGGSAEAARAVTMAGKLSVPSLTRAWQMLLKGLIEVRDAANPLPAAEMALVRLAYATDLPPTEKLVRSVLEGDGVHRGPAPSAPSRSPSGASLAVASRSVPQAAPLPSEQPVLSEPVASGPDIATLSDIVELAKSKGARLLATQLETNVHLVSLERGRIEFRPNAQAPVTLATDIAQRLRDWTNERWIVTVSRENGMATISEQRTVAERAKKDAVAAEPFVRAVLDAFPGAEIVAVRDREGAISDELPPSSDDSSDS
jgi:DNA polymerase-3 subunit gamma/tau